MTPHSYENCWGSTDAAIAETARFLRLFLQLVVFG